MPDRKAVTIGDMTSKEAMAYFQRRPSLPTLLRWIRVGVINKSTRRRVMLKYDQDGGQLRFKREYLDDFVYELNRKANR